MDFLALRIAPEVQLAQREGVPVVALESSVYVHGLPSPLNHETFLRVGEAVRGAGAVPATTAIIDGRVQVGLAKDEWEQLLLPPKARKIGSRDIGVAVATGATGATTISATMAIAHLAGIGVVASAGLGGVHRGWAQSMDISGDLVQLTRSRAVVVTAGAKKILDLPATVEYLETQGVPVISLGTDEFPGFYCRTSGVRSQVRIDDPATIAIAAKTHWSLPGTGSVLVTAPVEAEHAIPETEVENAIDAAVRSAARDGVSGPETTPYIMRSVNEATAGRADVANAAVLVSNAALGARIAGAMVADGRGAGDGR